METSDYIQTPVGATRLRSGAGHHFPDDGSDIQPAREVVVSVPNPPLSTSPSRRTHQFLSSMASPTLSTIPQLLLSASLPTTMHSGSASTSSAGTTTSGFTKGKTDQSSALLSSKDPLSLPIMTSNFKRFVTVVGPVFWLQDRMEEILLWKRGTLWTSLWMAAYTLLCFYPRLLFLLPHLVVVGGILATYPYPPDSTTDPLHAEDTSASNVPPTHPPNDSVPPWQTNIQAIQNLMGAYVDLHSLVEPYVHHFYLVPGHFSIAPQFPTSSPSSSSSSASSQPTTALLSLSPSPSRSPYTIHILTVLVLSFFPLVFIVHLPWFPVRALAILGGCAPVLLTHPYTRAVIPVLRPALLPMIIRTILLVSDRASGLVSYFSGKVSSLTCRQGYHYPPERRVGLDEGPLPRPQPMSSIIQRFIDDNKLTDECWNSEMREVELWENERYNGPSLPPAVADGTSSAAAMCKGWGKQHLRSGERRPWTRSRDGSDDVSGAGAGSGVEASGEVSSNLTFSLAPGWSFVESEDWRKDLQSIWSGCCCDKDGWVYTNDAWLCPRPSSYTSGEGIVTRRRRWVRRVWYNQKNAETEFR